MVGGSTDGREIGVGIEWKAKKQAHLASEHQGVRHAAMRNDVYAGI